MGFPFATGATTVSVNHGQYGASVTTSSTTLDTATFMVNVAGGIHFEVRKTDGSANLVNFDDFQIIG